MHQCPDHLAVSHFMRDRTRVRGHARDGSGSGRCQTRHSLRKIRVRSIALHMPLPSPKNYVELSLSNAHWRRAHTDYYRQGFRAPPELTLPHPPRHCRRPAVHFGQDIGVPELRLKRRRPHNLRTPAKHPQRFDTRHHQTNHLCCRLSRLQRLPVWTRRKKILNLRWDELPVRRRDPRWRRLAHELVGQTRLVDVQPH